MAARLRDLLRGGQDQPGGVRHHIVGNALVLHPELGISGEAQSLALSVVEDSDHDIVVLDLGEGMPIGNWSLMARALPRRRRGIRLVTCGRHPQAAALAGQMFSERLNRTVVAPDGDLIRGAGGVLFVHSMPGSGWVRFRPGGDPAWDAKRYPAPHWDSAATDTRSSSSTGQIEPLPGGVWIHDAHSVETVAEHRRRLTIDVPCRPETMTVLVGCPGTPALALDDVVRFWRGLDAANQARARFVQYGGVRIPEGEAFGQALADLFGNQVICYTGVPVGDEFRTVDSDGRLGWQPFARELRYVPRAHPNSEAHRPVVLSHRPPMADAEEVAPRVYWYALDSVVEVVQSGLWVRSPTEPANAEQVRARRLDPGGGVLLFDDTPERAVRMRELAEDLLACLDASVRAHTEVVPASTATPARRTPARAEAFLSDEEPGIGAVPSGPVAPLPEDIPAPVAPVTATLMPVSVEATPDAPVAPRPAPQAVHSRAEPPNPGASDDDPPPEPRAQPAVAEPVAAEPVAAEPVASDAGERPTPIGPGRISRLQPVPSPAASALLPSRPLAEERGWLRRTLSRDFDTMASSVARIISEHPGLQGNGSRTPDDILADSVATRLYLSARGDDIDTALRSARKGPHVPLARCAVAGLSRLPSYRGSAVIRCDLTNDEWHLYEKHHHVTDWAFVNALTEPCATQDGDTDVLLWSLSARRTTVLEPAGADAVTDRVVFLPGTSFKVLRLSRPSGGERGMVLLREIGANEIDAEGRVATDRQALDGLATTSLQRSAHRWSGLEAKVRIGPAAQRRFVARPGLVRDTHEEVVK